MIKGKDNPQDTKLRENMSRIKYKIAVLSGKGGVGKSTVSANLAWALAMRDLRVGILDADVHGPNMPKMLGIEERRFSGSDNQIEPVEVMPNLVAASVANIGYEPDAALIWRGPMKLGLIKQFLSDILWNDLDFLVVDTPPGTGDEVLTIGQEIKDLTGVIIVTTPQEVALLDSRKSANFAEKLKLPVIGIIENMADSDTLKVFGSGGGEAAAEKLGLPFLGRISIDQRMVPSGDQGRPFVADYADEPVGKQLADIVERTITYCKGISA